MVKKKEKVDSYIKKHFVHSYDKNAKSFKNTQFSKSKYKYVWILKDLNFHDKNAYISSYMNVICNSNKYVYGNK